MHDLNLIPEEFNQQLKLGRWLRNFSVIYIVLVLLIVFGKYQLDERNTTIESTIAQLQTGKQLTLQQQQAYDSQLKSQAELKKRLNILSGLRGGPPAERIFITFDEVMNGDIWFSKWTFRRAGEWTDVDPDVARPGYLIINTDANSKEREQAWRLSTHMEIKGQARNHSMLAEFIGRLIKRPEIEDVKVLNTSLRTYTTAQVIDFDLAVVVNNYYAG